MKLIFIRGLVIVFFSGKASHQHLKHLCYYCMTNAQCFKVKWVALECYPERIFSSHYTNYVYNYAPYMEEWHDIFLYTTPVLTLTLKKTAMIFTFQLRSRSFSFETLRHNCYFNYTGVGAFNRFWRRSRMNYRWEHCFFCMYILFFKYLKMLPLYYRKKNKSKAIYK